MELGVLAVVATAIAICTDYIERSFAGTGIVMYHAILMYLVLVGLLKLEKLETLIKGGNNNG